MDVYKVVCTGNGKCYIGKSDSWKQRWTYHKSMLKRGVHPSKEMQDDYVKYGKGAFEIVVLFKGLSEAAAIFREWMLVKGEKENGRGYNKTVPDVSVLQYRLFDFRKEEFGVSWEEFVNLVYVKYPKHVDSVEGRNIS